jgi:hypothetical protein
MMKESNQVQAAIKQSRGNWLCVVDTEAIEEEEGFRRCK